MSLAHNSSLLPVLRRNIVQHNLLPLLLLHAFLLQFHLFVLAKVRDVLGMNQIFNLCVLVVILFEMVNFVLVFIITVVSRPQTKVR